MSELGETTIKVVSFDGAKRNWSVWSEKFLARLNKKGIKYILTQEKLDIPKDGDVIDEKTESGKTLQKIKNDNAKVFEDLILSVDCTKPEGRIAFSLVKRGKDKENYKDGNAQIAWQKLKTKYEPHTVATVTRLLKEYHTVKMKSREDPEQYMIKLQELKERLEDAGGDKISDKAFLQKVLNTLMKLTEMSIL